MNQASLARPTDRSHPARTALPIGGAPVPCLDARRAIRGRFYPRWRARVIEQDDLFVVEFVDRPWYTEPGRRQEKRRQSFVDLLQAMHLL